MHPSLRCHRAFEARIAVCAARATVARHLGKRTKRPRPHDFTLGIVVVLVLRRNDALGCDAFLDPALQGGSDPVSGIAAACGAKLSKRVGSLPITAVFHA